MRWDLIDRFDNLKKGDRAKAFKHFSGREDFFKEHFPGCPRVPEVFFIEMVAQTGGLLFGLNIEFQKEVVLAKIERAQFRAEVEPPCHLQVEASIEERREEGAWIRGRVSHENRTVADVRLLLATVETLVDGRRHIVFNQKMLKHFGVDRLLKGVAA